MKESEKEKMLQLLADQAAFGLTEKEALEVKMLLKEFPEWENDNSFELAAAAIGLANLNTDEPMPQNLRMKIAADADKLFSSTADETQEIKSFAPKAGNSSGILATQNIVQSEPKVPFWQWLGWAFAAAACVALAVNIWTTRLQNKEVVKNPETIQTPTPEPSAAQKRQQILASANKIQTNWADTKPDDADVITGDVVWDNVKQEGYIRIQGLPVNDAKKETYQLWIFDENRNAKNPVDGGVFNVNENGEIIVPINAKLRIGKPKMFAVTVEKPDGVVVSESGKIVVTAKV